MRKVVVAAKDICRITGRETQEEGMDQYLGTGKI